MRSISRSFDRKLAVTHDPVKSSTTAENSRQRDILDRSLATGSDSKAAERRTFPLTGIFTRLRVHARFVTLTQIADFEATLCQKETSGLTLAAETLPSLRCSHRLRDFKCLSKRKKKKGGEIPTCLIFYVYGAFLSPTRFCHDNPQTATDS